MTSVAASRPGLGIAFVLVGMFCISLNDMLIKGLSGDYALHQIVFMRSGIGIFLSLVLVQLEGGLQILKTRNPVLHACRGLLLVTANMTYFAALAVLPLAETTALFFVAPLFITLLSVPLLGERVGPWRMSAVCAGFLGVLIMQRPWQGTETLEAGRLVLLLPVLAAATYALTTVLTRRLGVTSKASAMAVYIQATMITVSGLVYLLVGDGRYMGLSDNPSMVFLLRPWVWPAQADWPIFLGLGFNAGIIGYCMSQAYRLTDAAIVAPFEYVGLPLAVFWGYLIFHQLPSGPVWLGMALILGAGLVVFLRERHQKARQIKLR